jgi:iron complex outermembrane recepter protein
MTRFTLITLFFLIFSNLLLAQSPAASIKGKIADGGDQKIIDAATVSLLKAKDSSLVKITLTDKEGNFLFENISLGKYYLLATSTGHMQSYSKLLDVYSNSVFSVNTIQLAPNVKTLKEV